MITWFFWRACATEDCKLPHQSFGGYRRRVAGSFNGQKKDFGFQTVFGLISGMQNSQIHAVRKLCQSTQARHETQGEVDCAV
jgi:hypothetical protein